MKTEPRTYSRWTRHKTRTSRRTAWLLPLVGLVLALGGVYALYEWLTPARVEAVAPSTPATAAGKPAERTAALAPLTLPADDAAHGSGMEWWYYNGILDAGGGQRYAFHTAVFVANNLVKHTVMHMALTDLRTGKRYDGQSRTAGLPGKRAAGGFEFEQDGWRVAGAGPAHTVHASFDGVSIALDFDDLRQPVAHRAAGSATPGLLDFGSSGISYYYSRPRMNAHGQVSVDGKAQPVQGTAWFDHQWGEFDVLMLGWNWFALHLADGSDLMLYQLFDRTGQPVMTAGTVTDAKGDSTALAPGEIELTPGQRWTSPRTQISYVVEWRARLPRGVLEIKPYFADGEFDAGKTSANVYWEGPVKVGGAAEGEGFLELSGYERLGTASAGR